MENIFEVDGSFAEQAGRQAGGGPHAPVDAAFPGRSHFGVSPVTAEEVVARQAPLENFFRDLAPKQAISVEASTPPMPAVPHFNLRPDFERLADRSAPFSPCKPR